MRQKRQEKAAAEAEAARAQAIADAKAARPLLLKPKNKEEAFSYVPAGESVVCGRPHYQLIPCCFAGVTRPNRGPQSAVRFDGKNQIWLDKKNQEAKWCAAWLWSPFSRPFFLATS